MVGSIQYYPFDGSKKTAWLHADTYWFLEFSIMLFLLFAAIAAAIHYAPFEYVLIAMGVLAVAVAFVVIFVLRKNWAIIGEPRDFRYFCRWF